MQHVTHTAHIHFPIETCFHYVDTHENVPKWFFGVSEFTPIGQPKNGLGTTLGITAKIGPMTLRGRGRVCDYVENDIIAVRTEFGSVTVVVAWFFQPTSEYSTAITADITYVTAPGLAGRAVAKLAKTAIAPAIEHSERALRRQLLATAAS